MTDQELEAGRAMAEQAFQTSYAAWCAAGRPLGGPEMEAALDALEAWDNVARIPQCSPCDGGDDVV